MSWLSKTIRNISGVSSVKQTSGPSPEDEQKKRQRELLDQQKRYAADFDARSPKIEAESLSNESAAIRDSLRDRLRGSRSEAASRGLLSSGLLERDELKSRAQAGTEYASRATSIKSGIKKMSEAMQARVRAMELGKYEDAVMDADTAFDEALARYESRAGAIGAFSGALGTLGGAYFGSRKA